MSEAARLLREARHVVALTGAGMSTESGIPDFRSPGGLWSVFDPMEYATLDCFLRDPEKAWRLYRVLGASLAGKEPNPAHVALAELEHGGVVRGIVTQNVDGLHQRAGSRLVLEMHGSWSRVRCLACDGTAPFEPGFLADGPPPRCARCDYPWKPDVVLFGENVREIPAIDALLERCDLLLVAGTAAEVAPAAFFPAAVRRRGGRVIELNLSRCIPATAHVKGPVGSTLPRLVAAFREGPAV